MRGRVRLILLTGVLAIAMAVPAIAQAATPEDVNGVWTSIDPVDGSNQIMEVRVNPANRARIVLFDDFATGCGGGAADARGNGSLSGDDVTVTFRVRCENRTRVGPVTVIYTYDQATDTLSDGFGTVWSRA